MKVDLVSVVFVLGIVLMVLGSVLMMIGYREIPFANVIATGAGMSLAGFVVYIFVTRSNRSK